MSSSSEESEFEAAVTSTPPELLNAAQLLNDYLLPAKSKEKYNAAYENFLKWKTEKKATSFSENILMAYFGELAAKYKAGSLWAIYSMLKCTLKVNNSVNIEQYLKLKAFLKRKGEGYVPKKSKILTGENVEKFISEAPDKDYLATKVALILGIKGALRSQELCDITVDNIENHGEVILVNIPNTKNRIPRSFAVAGNYYKVIKKYQSLRSTKAKSNRFFQQYRNGKCTAQVIGKNKLASLPKEIAQYLNLPDASSYTGHSFRRTSATLLADSGVDILTLKRHGGWRSSTVAEGYIDDSFTNKIDISNKISKSIQLCQNIVPEPQEPIASCSSAIIQNMPALEKKDIQITNSIQPCQNTIPEPKTPIASCSSVSSANQLVMSQIANENQPSDQDLELATQNITNSIQSIKYPEKNMTLNVSNNSNCTITFNFNK